MIVVDHVSNEEFACFCPWHQDDNPSLMINLQKDAAYCFAGCYSGDAVGAIAKAEGITKTEAYRLILCDKAFIFDGQYENTNWQQKGPESPSFEAEESILGWVRAINLTYLRNRGFNNSSIVYWEVDYSDICRHIRIPIRDREGELAGYIYRTIDDWKPKYLYSKGISVKKQLFGINNFEPARNIVNIVEGCLDCIWMWQCGYLNTIAILGSDLGKYQVDLINKLSVGVVRLCLDGDKAGSNGTAKAIKLLKEKGLDVIAVNMPEGKDVQDFDAEELFRLINGR